jgi:selenocysteine lyase/cysteine desulfurase
MVPAHLARFGISMEGRHEADHDATTPPRLASGARRFEVGNPNFPALVAVEVAMRRLLETGMEAIEEKALSLAALMRTRLGTAGLPIVNTAAEGASHILTLGGSGFPAASLHGFLDRAGIKASLRKGAVRFSFHGYNDETDVGRAVAACEAWQRAGSSGAQSVDRTAAA